MKNKIVKLSRKKGVSVDPFIDRNVFTMKKKSLKNNENCDRQIQTNQCKGDYSFSTLIFYRLK